MVQVQAGRNKVGFKQLELRNYKVFKAVCWFHPRPRFYLLVQDWQNTQLLHVFQEQLIVGAKRSALAGSTGAPGEEALERNVGLLETSYQVPVLLKPVTVLVFQCQSFGKMAGHARFEWKTPQNAL